MAMLCFVFMKETYAPVILERKTKKLQKSTGNPNLQSKLKRQISAKELFKLSLLRPMRMLLNPAVLFISIFMATVYGYMYLLYTTYPTVFEGTYGFSGGTVGLTYMGFGIGSVSSVLLFARFSDNLSKRLSSDGVMKPEYRLPPMIPGGLFVPIGLFWYGWSAEAKVHWIVPIIGTGFIGFGLTAIFVCLPFQLLFCTGNL